MLNNGYNPDVLSCLANLSSDEVFTPPHHANRILDMLPAQLWSDKNARFLDPFCKSGVFLREIAKRLDAGLEKSIRDRQKRINHIFKNQIFAIAVTELTALLARRSVYCSKKANGKYSICDAFGDEYGNIRFKRVKHKWKRKRCVSCGASQQQYDRSSDLEMHAYELIHTEDPEDIFKMKFDVIIGNPPYQLGADGGTRDIPIYRKLVDNERMDEVFPGVDFEGGVCYFLWDRDNEGDCDVTTISGDDVNGPVARNLNEYDIFVRDSRALNILHKVLSAGEKSITEILSVDKEFGWTSNFEGFHEKQTPNDISLHYNRKGRR